MNSHRMFVTFLPSDFISVKVGISLVNCASRNGAIGPSSSVGGAPGLTAHIGDFGLTRSAVVRH